MGSEFVIKLANAYFKTQYIFEEIDESESLLPISLRDERL